MCYDLGLAYQGAGDSENALKSSRRSTQRTRATAMFPTKYRNCSRAAISMQQLKNDIEREISSKFLAEGERIEREEKTRKNERVTDPGRCPCHSANASACLFFRLLINF